MLDKSNTRTPFYSHLCNEIDPGRITYKQPLFARGCSNSLLARYYILFQKQSLRRPEQFSTVIIKQAGIIAGGVSYIANIDGKLLEALIRYKNGIPSDKAGQYPAIYEILRPGSNLTFDGHAVTLTNDQPQSIGQHTFMSEVLITAATTFADNIEKAYDEAISLLASDIEASTPDVKEKIDFISSQNLNLPIKKSLTAIDFYYCELLKSKFWGTKCYIIQSNDQAGMLTVYVKGSNIYDPKCKIVAQMRDLDIRTLKDLWEVYNATYSDLPAEFIKTYPTLTKLLQEKDLPGKYELSPVDFSLTLACTFPIDMNRDIPEDVFHALPVFITILKAAINELGNLRRTSFYTNLHKIARKKDKSMQKALLRRLTFIGIGALIGSSFDSPDLDVDSDTSDMSDTSDTSGTSDSPTVIAPQPAQPFAMPQGIKSGYLISNPFGDSDMMYSMFEIMHEHGQLDDGSFQFVQGLKNHVDNLSAQTRQMTDDLLNDIQNDLQGGRTNIIGPSPEEWDRFDSYEHIRENAVDSYNSALEKGNLDEAARQAKIACEAQSKKEGIYSVRYTSDDLAVRAGL